MSDPNPPSLLDGFRRRSAIARRNGSHPDWVVVDVDGLLIHLERTDADRLHNQLGVVLAEIAAEHKPAPVHTESGMTELDLALSQQGVV